MGPQVLPREMDGETRAISQQLALQIKAEMYRYQEKECGVVPVSGTPWPNVTPSAVHRDLSGVFLCLNSPSGLFAEINHF